MNKPLNNRMQQREKIIDQLTENLVESTVAVLPKECDPDTRKKIRHEVSDRITFEANVALNEMVTKYCLPETPREEKQPEQEERTFLRFGKNFRAQHMLMFVSVIILIITGMPLKFPELSISKFLIIDLMGGLENSTLIHRVGAVGLILVGIWHLLYTALTAIGRRDFFLMIPMPKDIKDFWHTMLYFFGRRASGPKFARFSFIEKFDYWAVYWGMIIMIGSGSIMWFKELFPKFAFDISREAHSDEGLLATLSIVVWHFYNVHFNPGVFPMSWTWWHGRLTESEMKHHHALEYAEIIEAESKEIRAGQNETDNTGGES
ncbi:MAG: cytochrome b/b6 domain-containing protein [bacterium]|nr:cytochrome b/b6 domain-containing protein [bacterium]